MVADALDNRQGTGVADAEALTDHAPDEGLAARGPVEDHIAGDHLLLGPEGRVLGWLDGDATAREPLAEVVVGVADQAQRDAPGHERSEAVAG